MWKRDVICADNLHKLQLPSVSENCLGSLCNSEAVNLEKFLLTVTETVV